MVGSGQNDRQASRVHRGKNPVIVGCHDNFLSP
jgi:hypothetical protein